MRAFVVAAVVLSGLSTAQAADLIAKAPIVRPVPSDWTGVYVGGFVGGAWANLHYSDPAAAADGSTTASGFVGGVYAGYDYELANRFVLGAKVVVPLGEVSGNTTVLSLGPAAPSSGRMRWATNINGTLGYDMGWWMPYVGAGVAFLSNRLTLGGTAGNESDTEIHTGLNLLVGAKFRFARNWAAGLQFNHTEYSGQTYTFPANFDSGVVKIRTDALVGTLEYRF